MSGVKEEKELWQEVREVRQEVNNFRKETYEEFKQVREEIHRVEVSLREELNRIDKKFTTLMLIVIFLIIFLNQNALEFIFRVFGLVK
ncbi:hypothetical protein [Hydrogenivirga sp. 128-5-R1-1]|uniref:hypothetical protein n=1 Tax=Hydrogenivirga sp. 128-5-R1-1 TaxID=392423 RepID=UPI00015F191E|nr:hypothetical protein [Hydrogenivirga sp. 128-5-R1-1]EDP75389.1 hypothetical protein HG1285_15531 [Hydrogenivirga sp. 128-5-R1-1]